LRDRLGALGVPALGPAPLFRRQGRHRAQLVVKAPEREPTIAAVRQAVDSAALPRGVNLAVDVDPE
jgi:primosomal protein N'